LTPQQKAYNCCAFWAGNQAEGEGSPTNPEGSTRNQGQVGPGQATDCFGT